MNYAEAAFFDGNHCAHVAAFHEYRRLARIDRTHARAAGGRYWRNP